MAKEIKKFSWGDMYKWLCNYNAEHAIQKPGGASKGDYVTVVVVITEDSFDKPYALEERSYAFSSDNRAFLPGMISNSIFANCLDGKDVGVRLDWYVGHGWNVDYCYIVEED